MNNNPLTNQTYINKDFQTIYPELLDLVKKLTYKWDPTISNESDPGVLLIKLNAIIADKNNYNIDKNILECFPDTVTQQDNAYKLFSQLGYNMRWYKSAMGEIYIRWKGDPLENSSGSIDKALIPAFTMVCNKDKDIVYTIINKTELPTDGSTIQTNVIQGVIRDMTIAGEFLINSSMLDYRNRIYLPVTNVAENGIFISDAVKDGDEYIFVWDDPTKSIGWKKVDNLYIQPLRTKCYKFGIDQENNSCYIEFPNDITDLMGEGIRIKYIQSDGGYGNIAAKRLTQFYDDLEFDYSGKSGQEETINISLNSALTNYSSITNGKNPETIDEAYVNYKKELGTFDTLVTLRDYINYIVNEEFEHVSNGIVSDRTNDIQSSYEIVTTFNGETTVKNVVTIDKDNTPEMSPFDLKTYFLSYHNWPKYTSGVSPIEQSAEFKNAYDKTFNLILNENSKQEPLSTTDLTKRLYREAKSIEHDFIAKLPYRPLLIKNKFDLSLKVIPNNIVSQAQAEEIKTNINETLLKELQSKNIAFGEEITYEQIYDICNSADNRVKAVALDNIEYHPFAVIYFDNLKSVTKSTDTNTSTDNTVTYILEDNNDLLINVKLSKDIEIDEDGGLFEIPIPTEITSDDYSELTLNELIALEICSKNILCGTTPMYHVDKSFNYTLNQSNVDFIKDIDKITTSNKIQFDKISSTDWTYMSESSSVDKNKESKSKMLDNETLFLYAPSLIDDITYSTSVKYLYITNGEYSGTDTEFIPANQDYVLTTGQYLYFFWKEEDNEDSPYLYMRYEKGTILKSSTKLIKYKEEDEDEYNYCSAQLLALGYTGEGQIYGELNSRIGKISGTILSATKNVVIKKLNDVKLTDDKNYCYWITNNVVNNKYRLTLKYVPKNGTGYSVFEYLLKSNEMFIYTDSSKKGLYILENGTKITLIKPNSEIKDEEITDGVPNDLSFDVPTMNRDTLIDDIENEGEKAFTDSMWHVFECNYIDDTEKLVSGELIRIIENQILSLGEGTAIRVKPKSPTSVNEFNYLKIDSENGVMISSDGNSWVHKSAALSNYIIQYLPDEENAQWREVPIVSDESLSWDGYTILHINSGANKPQKLDSIHSQHFKCHIHTDDPTEDNYVTIDNVYVQTSTFTNLYGGKDVDVVRTDANNNKYYLDIMYYKLNNIFDNNENIKSLDNNRYGVTLNSESSELILKDISIRNNTILGIEFITNVNNVTSFNIVSGTGTSGEGTSGTDIDPIGYENKSIVSNKTIKAGTYYYNITDIGNSTVTAIKFSLSYDSEAQNKEPVSFIINPLFKYDTELNSKYEKDRNIPINLIEDDISTRWDVFHNIDGTQFDYTYVPNSDELIYDPLRPKNYFNTSHKYNHFTIPQISNVNTEIMNKRG